MNINALRSNRNLLILALVVPAAGYLIYKNLTPAQKKRFNKSLSHGSMEIASVFFTRLMDNYKASAGALAGPGRSLFTRMAQIPNINESETTIGDEKW